MAIEAIADPALEAEIRKYEAAYSRDPRSRAFAALADAYRRAGRLEEAIIIAELGLKAHPRYLSGVVVLGRAYLQSGRTEEARAQLERVVEINPDNLAAQRTLGDIYFDRKEWGRARKAYMEILRVQPDDSLIKARIEHIESARAGAEAVTQPARAASVASMAVPAQAEPGRALTEEEKMDVFFAGVDLTRPNEESRSADYEVKPLQEVFASAPPQAAPPPRPPEPARQAAVPGERQKSPITTETMAQLYIKQGYKDKALLVYEEIYQADPSRKDIEEIINRLRADLGIERAEESAAPVAAEAVPEREIASAGPLREAGPARGAPITPPIARPTRALKDFWEKEPEPDIYKGEMTEAEKRAASLRRYLEIVRRGGREK